MKSMIARLLTFLGSTVNRKESKQKRMKRMIDNDPVLNQIDKNVSDMNNRSLERLKKEDPELYELVKQFK